MVLPDSYEIPRAPQYLGTVQGSAAPFGYGTITHSGQAFQACSPRRRICNSPGDMRIPQVLPHDPRCATVAPLTHTGFRLFPVRSPLLGESLLFSVPRGTKMFQFPRLPSHAYVFSMRWPDITPARLPHSGTPGSKPVGGSPRIIAAYCALRRPLAPRHPPCALISLKTSPVAFV